MRLHSLRGPTVLETEQWHPAMLGAGPVRSTSHSHHSLLEPAGGATGVLREPRTLSGITHAPKEMGHTGSQGLGLVCRCPLTLATLLPVNLYL